LDDQGNVWFLSANDSHKNIEINSDPHVTLYFQGSSHSDFLVVKGIASISDDESRIKKLWKPMLKTWFTEGENDPRISVIKWLRQKDITGIRSMVRRWLALKC
jgi:general stress protein 26